MTDYIKGLENPSYPSERKDAERAVDWLRNKATITDGVIRWNSNNVVPFDDMIALAVHIGLPVDRAKCTAAREAGEAAFIAEYRARQPAEPSPEERAEARAAHGPGVEIVDVLSGRKFTT